jgi:hypothetical protein
LWAQGRTATLRELKFREALPPPNPAVDPDDAAAVLKSLREQLASKNEKLRIRAVERLGGIPGREARTMLAEKLTTDTLEVRRVAAMSLAAQKHPSSAEALGKAFNAHASQGALADVFLQALGELGMCASIVPPVEAVEIQEFRFSNIAIGEILRIGCVEAAPGLAAILKRAEAEAKKNDLSGRNKNLTLARMAPELKKVLERLTGVQPGPNESWTTFVSRGGVNRKLVSIYQCSKEGKTFELPANKTGPSPFGEPGKSSHEDVLLKHRDE